MEPRLARRAERSENRWSLVAAGPDMVLWPIRSPCWRPLGVGRGVQPSRFRLGSGSGRGAVAIGTPKSQWREGAMRLQYVQSRCSQPCSTILITGMPCDVAPVFPVPPYSQ